jgi:hypothetical protein
LIFGSVAAVPDDLPLLDRGAGYRNDNPKGEEAMRERIAFQTNVPMTVALAYADGLQVEGRFGDQIMYTLADERVMYVPPVVRNKLVELGIQPGELFTVCKAEHKQGNRRLIEWQVKKDDAPNDQPPWEMPPVNSKMNGHASPKPRDGHAASHLQNALASSIDAAIAAEQYAATKGFSLRFGSEDLRAMALSLFIQHAREGGLR